MTDGERMLKLAATRLGEKYVNVLVPKNNPNWHGPWDCAEFMSWLVYQIGGYLYGCVDDNADPATVEAYTGAWQTDSKKLGIQVSVEQAAATVGAILLRYPPGAGKMGHIVVSDGKGGTIEAMGKKWGVTRGKVSGRNWNTGILLPKFTYVEPAGSGGSGTAPEVAPPDFLYAIGQPDMTKTMTKTIQKSLKKLGFSPGPISGVYDALTTAAVGAFQATKGLVVDGQVGKQTARALKIPVPKS